MVGVDQQCHDVVETDQCVGAPARPTSMLPRHAEELDSPKWLSSHWETLLAANCHTLGAAVGRSLVVLNPIFRIAAVTSAALINVRQTNCELMFAAISMEIPTLMPTTSGFVQSVFGLKASTIPYRFQSRFP